MLTLTVVLTLTLYAIADNKVDCETSFQNSDGKLIFSDEFDFLDLTTWSHDNTLAGGGNWEFQWYTNNRTNSFVKDGNLFIKPTLTADQFGEKALTSMTLDLNRGAPADYCTDSRDYGCVRTGNSQNILNPVKSAKLSTKNSFDFKYGRVKIRAKLPSGDWLWPAIWLLPSRNTYGEWPASGEIDIVESRGNRYLTQNGVNIGNQKVGATLHWGPDQAHNQYTRTHWEKDLPNFAQEFHVYELLWTPFVIKFFIDGEQIGNVSPPVGNFWKLGDLSRTNLANPWAGQSRMAPFDQKFYLIINLAVGGIAYFPDDAVNFPQKPWKNNSPKAATDFWNGRSDWLPTWDLKNSNKAALQIDYVRVYKL